MFEKVHFKNVKEKIYQTCPQGRLILHSLLFRSAREYMQTGAIILKSRISINNFIVNSAGKIVTKIVEAIWFNKIRKILCCILEALMKNLHFL